MTLAAGTKLGRYEIRSKLGEGGMGEVYLAQDTKLDRKVALKILPAEVAADRNRMNRFVQEAKAASALNHPNIITIHEIEQTESGHFIAMEFIDGETLRERMRKAPIKLHEVLDVAAQIASALVAAQAASIVHRDLKPENIMLRRDGIVKVLDFGLAKLIKRVPPALVDTEAPTRAAINTDLGVIMGTAVYMSPEQARGLQVDARTDIFSLGVLIYEVVAGRLPFDGSNINEILASILSDKEPPPLARYAREVPPEFERIISKALRKNREERYQTVKDMLLDLKSLKQELELERKLERSVPPRSRNAAETREQAEVEKLMAAHQSVDEKGVTSALFNQRNVVIAASVLLMFALVTTAYIYFTRTRAGVINSVAVLPFVNGSGDPDTEYLSDGISESLINSLSQLPGTKVIARSSSFKYKGKEVDPQEAARALGVEAVLTGHVAQRGENLLIAVELVDARDKTQVWGEQYNRKAIDLLAVQSEISREIAEALRLRLTSKDQQRLTKRETQNPEAYQLYLNGLFYDRKKGAESLRKALDYYQQAIALDPNFALAYAGMSSTYTFLAESGLLNAKEALSRSKAAAMKALEVDETLADAHWALANIKANEWDWAGAESQYKRAIELNPSLAVAHYDYAYYLGCMERYSEALAEIKRAQELDPLNVHFRATEGFILWFARRYDEAIQRLQTVIKTEPDNPTGHAFLGFVYDSKRLYPEAIVEYQKFFSLEKESTSAECYLGYAYAMSGKHREALALLQKLMTTKEYVSSAELAVLYAGLGNKEEALGLLENAYEAHDLQLRHLKVDPHYDGLRADPRFTELVRRVGLAQ